MILLHFSLVQFQIFNTPEGILSNEQGVYVAESVAAKNTKQAKGRFRMYDDQDGLVCLFTLRFYCTVLPLNLICYAPCYSGQDDARSNHSVKRDQPNREVAGVGKRDNAKVTKKAGKFCSRVCFNIYFYYWIQRFCKLLFFFF